MWNIFKKLFKKKKNKKSQSNYSYRNSSEKIINLLNCPCETFKGANDDNVLMDAYKKAFEEGREEGFIPVIIVPDEILLQTLDANSQRNTNLFEEFERIQNLQVDTLDDIYDIDTSKEDIKGNMAFSSYWDIKRTKTQEVILAKVPTKNPWEIFKWIPFGGFNDCPNTPELMATSKRWYENHGAYPAVISYNTLEYSTSPIEDVESATKLSIEQYVFCRHIVDKGFDSVSALADSLTKSSVWFFWWD